MPARKKPVINRKANKIVIFFANQRMEMFATAAIKDEIKKTFEELNLSAIEKIANNNVPAIKPNCTTEVIFPNWSL